MNIKSTMFLTVLVVAATCVYFLPGRQDKTMIPVPESLSARNKDEIDVFRALNTVRFVENTGQHPTEVLFSARLSNGAVFFCRNEIFFSVRENQDKVTSDWEPRRVNTAGFARKRRLEKPIPTSATISFSVRYAGSRQGAEPSGQSLRIEKTNLFSGGDPSKWKTGLATFDTLMYRDLYPGIDLIFFGSEGYLKYEFHASNPASYSMIEMEYRDIDSLSVRPNGELALMVGSTTFVERAPLAYQMHEGERIDRPVVFLPTTSRSVRFSVDGWDERNTLVIDPVYSTLFGGSGVEGGMGIVWLSPDIICIGGSTTSSDFPITQGAFRGRYEGRGEAFILCLDIQHGTILFSTYFGGSDNEYIQRIAVDPMDRIVVAGETTSTDLPLTSNAFQKSYRGNQDCFIAVFDSGCSSLVYSSYIGGTGFEDIFDMTMDSHGDVYITGLTDSRNYPVTSKAVQRTYGGRAVDVFVTKLKLSDFSPGFSTYLGGYDYDEGYTIHTDASSKVYIGGLANSRNFPVTADAFQRLPNSIDQGFVSILDSSGSMYLYGTFIGGSQNDLVQDLGFDDYGNLIVFGETTSHDLRTTPGVFQPRRAREDSTYLDIDFFIIKLKSSRQQVEWWTYLGGSELEYSRRMLIINNQPLIIGISKSNDYPQYGALKDTLSGKYDIVITMLSSDGSKLAFSTFYGGNNTDAINYASGLSRSICITGFTLSPDYPVTSNTLKDSLEGADDAYMTVLDLDAILVHIDDPMAISRSTTIISQNYPNPFTSEGTEIEYTQVAGAPTELLIYDSKGHLIENARFDSNSQNGNRYHFSGEGLIPGVYFYTVVSGSERVTKKMVKIE